MAKRPTAATKNEVPLSILNVGFSSSPRVKIWRGYRTVQGRRNALEQKREEEEVTIWQKAWHHLKQVGEEEEKIKYKTRIQYHMQMPI